MLVDRDLVRFCPGLRCTGKDAGRALVMRMSLFGFGFGDGFCEVGLARPIGGTDVEVVERVESLGLRAASGKSVDIAGLEMGMQG